MSLATDISFVNESATITSLSDGATYRLPPLEFTRPNVFAQIAFTELLAVKMPTNAWLNDFRDYVIKGKNGNTEYPLVRLADAEEKNVDVLLKRFPEFHPTYKQHADHTHFLMVHKLQYERVKKANRLRIPQSRYILVEGNSWFRRTLIPVILQERILGTTLLEMYDSVTRSVKSEWRRFLPEINSILTDLMESNLRNHINWFIRNFLYDPKTNVLSYVDVKPSCLFLKSGNEQNIRSLQERFFKE